MKKPGYFALFILIILVIIYLILPDYAQRAFIYLYANIDDYEIFENRKVVASNPQPWQISEDYNQYEIGAAYLDTLRKYETTAFLVVKDTALLYEQYYEGYSKEQISNSFSAAKSIVSLLIGIAIQEDYIKSIYQPVHDFLPNFDKGKKSSMIIRDLLTMSSGFKWNEGYSNPFSVTTQAYYGSDLQGLIKDLKMADNPGVSFSYKSIDTQVLASILEIATGQSISEYATNRLWRKIGAEQHALWSLDKAGGTEKAFCCFNSTARDFARIGQLVLNEGRWNDGRQVVHPDYVKMATTPAGYSDPNAAAGFYGYQWWIIDYNEKKIPYARGILGQYIFILKDKNAVVVRLGKKRSKVYRNQHPAEVYSYLAAAYELLK